MRRACAGGAVATLVFLVCGAVHCGGSNDAHFTAASDAAFVGGVAGAFSGTSAAGAHATLTVCEATGPSAAAPCEVPSTTECSGASCHVIRGAGAADESITTTGGCSCGEAEADLPVHVVVILDDGEIVPLEGLVTTVPAKDDPYGGPVALRAYAAGTSSDEARGATSLLGEVKGDGTMLLTLALRGPFDPSVFVVEAGAAGAGVAAALPGPSDPIAFTRTAGPEACP